MTSEDNKSKNRTPDESLRLVLGAMLGDDATWEADTRRAALSLSAEEREELEIAILVEEAYRKLEPIRERRRRLREFRKRFELALANAGAALDRVAVSFPPMPIPALQAARSGPWLMRERGPAPAWAAYAGMRGAGDLSAARSAEEAPVQFLAADAFGGARGSQAADVADGDEWSISETEADLRAGELLARHVPMYGKVDIDAICEEQGLLVMTSDGALQAAHLYSNGDVGAVLLAEGLPEAARRNLAAVGLACHRLNHTMADHDAEDLLDYSDATRMDVNLLAGRLLIPEARITERIRGGRPTLARAAAVAGQFGTEFVTALARLVRLSDDDCAAIVTDEEGSVVTFVPSRTFVGTVEVEGDLPRETILESAWDAQDGKARIAHAGGCPGWLEGGTAADYRMQSRREGDYVYTLIRPVA